MNEPSGDQFVAEIASLLVRANGSDGVDDVGQRLLVVMIIAELLLLCLGTHCRSQAVSRDDVNGRTQDLAQFPFQFRM